MNLTSGVDAGVGGSGQGCQDSSDQEPSIPHFGVCKSVDRGLEFGTEVLCEVLINLKSGYGKHIDFAFIDVVFIDGSYSSLICSRCWDRFGEERVEIQN
ncbi:hypothetical protein CEXT_664541 [Caerostris extrusa]|uniref:Uncharacterized protein n=1 Tax=Caerostris extrusa TaxID=172846 RepID=A0AAV4WT76_CAEEX|nr:hypothetical protein CEXT_664541 [Caerostris extrusa]